MTRFEVDSLSSWVVYLQNKIVEQQRRLKGDNKNEGE
jgi:hypothetical protein